MPRSKITKRTLDAAEPGERDYFVWDTSFAGFGFRVSPKGRKTFVFQYRLTAPGEAAQTPPVRYTIGRYGNITPEQARKTAEKLAGMVANGIDPRSRDKESANAAKEAKQAALQRERLEAELAFSKYADGWLDHYEHQKGRRPSSVSLAKLVVENYLKPCLGDKPMPQIGRTDLQQILDGIPAPKRAMRRAVYSYASILWGWALNRGDVATNPLATMEKPAAPPARERVLSDTEVKLLWLATHKLSVPFDSFVRILLLTGQRRSEVSGMIWAELDRDSATWTIPKARAKNRAANIVPLSAPVMAELDALAIKAWGGNWPKERPHWPLEGFVLTTTGKTPISGLSKAKAKLDDEMAKLAQGKPVEPWRFHDIRRTVATAMQRLGVRLEVTEAALHHLSGSRAGIVGVYQLHDWKDEKRTALQDWAARVNAMVDDRGKDKLEQARNLLSAGSSKPDSSVGDNQLQVMKDRLTIRALEKGDREPLITMLKSHDVSPRILDYLTKLMSSDPSQDYQVVIRPRGGLKYNQTSGFKINQLSFECDVFARIDYEIENGVIRKKALGLAADHFGITQKTAEHHYYNFQSKLKKRETDVKIEGCELEPDPKLS